MSLNPQCLDGYIFKKKGCKCVKRKKCQKGFRKNKETNECEPVNKMKTNDKYIYQSCLDNSRPFGYETSDLKNLYLTRNQLQSRVNTHILTQEQLLLARSSKCGVGEAESAGPMKSCQSNRFK